MLKSTTPVAGVTRRGAAWGARHAGVLVWIGIAVVGFYMLVAASGGFVWTTFASALVLFVLGSIADGFTMAILIDRLQAIWEHVHSVLAAPPTLRLQDIFLATGEFVFRALFQPHVLDGPGLHNRKAVLRVLAECTAAEFQALAFPARQSAFKLLKREFARYKGTARELRPGSATLLGRPLPRLVFQPWPGKGIATDRRNHLEAAAYRAVLEQAMQNVTRCSKTPLTLRPRARVLETVDV